MLLNKRQNRNINSPILESVWVVLDTFLSAEMSLSLVCDMSRDCPVCAVVETITRDVSDTSTMVEVGLHLLRILFVSRNMIIEGTEINRNTVTHLMF